MSKLLSEKLKQKFGDIKAKVIRQDETLRESFLVSKKTGEAYVHAIVFFGPDFEKVGKLRAAMPLGEALKSKDYKVRRQQIDSFMVKLSKPIKKTFKTEKDEALAVTIRLFAKSDHTVFDIGRIVEIYNPNFDI